MNIYLVSRTDIVDYDEFDSFVVAAETEELARKVSDSSYSWPVKGKEDTLEVKLVGTAVENSVEGVILGSFNAG